MGIFQDLVVLVNRAPVPLSVRFDGQETTILPGENNIPRVCISNAKNQNPIMGSQQPYIPHMSGAKYLVGVKGTKDDCTPLTKAEWLAHLGNPSRYDVDALFDGQLKQGEKVVVKKRKISAHEAKETVANEFGGEE